MKVSHRTKLTRNSSLVVVVAHMPSVVVAVVAGSSLLAIRRLARHHHVQSNTHLLLWRIIRHTSYLDDCIYKTGDVFI